MPRRMREKGDWWMEEGCGIRSRRMRMMRRRTDEVSWIRVDGYLMKVQGGWTEDGRWKEGGRMREERED